MLYFSSLLNIWPCLFCMPPKWGTPRKLLKNPFHKDSAPFFATEKVSVVFPKEFMLMVHKELSKSYRDHTAEKLKSVAQPYDLSTLLKM